MIFKRNFFIRRNYAVVFIAGLLMVFWGLATTFSSHVDAAQSADSGSRLVTIYDGELATTIVTKAPTVGKALEQAKVSVITSDIVEPNLQEKLVAKSYKVNIFRSRPILVNDGARSVRVVTAEQSLKNIAKTAGVILYDEDKVVLSKSNDIIGVGSAGLELNIQRATAFEFAFYGKTFTARTQAKTVGDMLKEKNIKMSKADGISMSLDTPIASGMVVKLWRNGKQTVTQEEVIPKVIEEIKDMDYERGYRAIKTSGKDGKRNVTYEIDMRDGAEISRKEIASTTVLEPVTEVVMVGAKVMGSYTTPTQNETITWNFLINKGLSRNQAAGIMGNLMQEHRFNTNGDGLAQWTGGRKANLMSKPDPYNIHTQLDFLWQELSGPYVGTLGRIINSSTVEGSVRAFQNGYERCGICREDLRVQYAYNILASH